ncbi:geminin coiled-coil domain-containing protein 1, partial [Pseudoliparis swirei]|uniref:geminin coiled-coil domain-containing protein 1 n=1 Tax=Pseudoliparis swirei TaxID=2059687 RepID=UPI0024BEC57D
AGLMWSDGFSPHLQRNKQLQDTLLQREEELLRLQDENQQLRGFLGSAFVRNLQREAQKLNPDGRRKPKRRLMDVHDGSFQNRGPQFQSSQVRKRVCRNLTAEFSSSSSSSSSEPNLDLWVLRTLGLKDRDTIDTSAESSSGFGPGGLVRDLAESPETCAASPGRRFAAAGLTAQGGPPEEVTRSYRTSPAFRPPPSTEEPPFSRSAGGAEARPPAYWSPLRGPPSRDPISSSSPTPCSRTDVAFRMSLSPTSSVKTHSFPQGQAFVRKTTEGRCNFTWVPTQRP